MANKLIYGDTPREAPSNAIVIMINGNITTTKRDCIFFIKRWEIAKSWHTSSFSQSLLFFSPELNHMV